MFSSSTFIYLTVLTQLALSQTSQNANDSVPLLIEAVKANFVGAGIVPSLLKEFDPVALLVADYPNGSTVGQKMTVDDVKNPPVLHVGPANASVSESGLYTLAMVDAGVAGSDELQQTRHWLVNNVAISNQKAQLDLSSALNITNYAGPFPASGSGPHRYVILLYSQPSSFKPPSDLSSPNTAVGSFNFPQYVQTTGLQGPYAGTYIQVEQGVATVSIPETSAVITSTLSVPQSPTSAAHSGTGSAASPSATSAATRNISLLTELGLLLTVVAMFF